MDASGLAGLDQTSESDRREGMDSVMVDRYSKVTEKLGDALIRMREKSTEGKCSTTWP